MELDWTQYRPAEGTILLRTIDAHAAGESLRIITGGLAPLSGATMLERRRFMQEHYDHLRKAVLWEPRGHFHMYGAVLTSSVTPEADLGVLFLHNEGYSTMCGHGIIALVSTLVKTGAIRPQGPQTSVTLDTPAGLVRATAHHDSTGQVERVSFLNVPSFVYAREVEVELPTYGRVVVDIAFGGAFYAILPAERVGLRVVPEATAQLVAAGSAIKEAVTTRLSITHPLEEDLGFLYGTILTDVPQDPAHQSRNICVFANAEVDRSPTGTGVSARLALHAALGEVADDQPVVIESILGARSVFSGRIAGRTTVGPFEAIIPEVSGTAFLTGRHEFLIEATDHLGQGFLLS
ncbi:MAG TPA: proline racemase family protein [Ktedonobacteraceae bacterium]|nr:proline racemase family protein [Ktedonobacteraceae bacterium]